jgi:hypothetical protein
MSHADPHVYIELRPSSEGCYVKARIETKVDGMPVTRWFVGILDSKAQAVTDATSWALGWLRRMRAFGA